MAVSSDSQSYAFPSFVRSTGRWKIRITPFTSVGGVLFPINKTPFSRRLTLLPVFTPSVQVMVRVLPSTTVTAPTGSMVTVWATELPNIAKGTDNENQLREEIVLVKWSAQIYSQR